MLLPTAAHVMKSDNGAVAVQEVVCSDIPPDQIEKEHAIYWNKNHSLLTCDVSWCSVLDKP